MAYTIAEFEEIYTRNVGRCMRLAVSLLADADDARDTVQDVFLKLWESDYAINNPDAFVLRAVRNACLDRLRAISIRDRIRQGLPIEPPISDDDAAEMHDSVRHAVDTLLPDRERKILDMIYSDGMSYKDAAESLEVSVSLINKCLVSAMKTLRKHFHSK